MNLINGKQIDDIEESDLIALVENKISEKKTIEFKEAIHGYSDGDKKEFLADISSFTNAAGGFIIYGIREEAGEAVEINGLQGINADNEILRLENSILDGIKPRIPGFSSRVIKGEKEVIIIHVPKSWAAPHMVTYKNSSKFYSRNSAGKYQLDVQELRAAFVLSETVSERIKQFRVDRVSKILNGETLLKLHDAPIIVLHLVPFEAFSTNNVVDISAIETKRSLQT